MASPYEIYNQYGNGALGNNVFGSGAYTPLLSGDSYGSSTDPAGTTAAINTPAPVDYSQAGPWGLTMPQTGGGSNPNAWPTIGGGTSNNDFQWGFNPGSINLVLGGLKTIAGLWQAWEQNKLQKHQLNLQKQLANANLANQVMAYNTTLEDRINNRMQSGGWTPEQGSSWIASHRLANTQLT
jgi:hypothetical protein